MKRRGWKTRALRILPVALAALAAAGCEGEPYVVILPAPPYPVMHRGDSVQLIGAYVRDRAVFPFASSAVYLYDSQARPRAFTWESSGPAVATVDEDGVLRAVGVGVAEIRVSAEGLRSRPDSVTVLHTP
jgi:Bacterial Ig-like domain (group 2)